MAFDAIVVTASSEKQAVAFQNELEFRKQRGRIPHQTLVLAVPDPTGSRIGSGGATLNALLALAERYSGVLDIGYLDISTLSSKRVLIIHSGGDSRRSPCQSVSGKAWSHLPSETAQGEINAPIDFLIEKLSVIMASSPPGVTVSCSDVLLLLPSDPALYDWSEGGITGLAIPASASYGPKHGVYFSKEGSNRVHAFLQKPSMETLRVKGAINEEGNIAIDSGVIFIDSPTAKLLLSHFTSDPLDASTYIGVDRGATAIRIELYSDLLLPLKGVEEGKRLGMQTKEEYVGMDGTKDEGLVAARKILWNELKHVAMYVNIPKGSAFAHVGTTSEYMALISGDSAYKRFHEEYNLSKLTHSYVCENMKLEGSVVVTNSLVKCQGSIGAGSIIENCSLDENGIWQVGGNCLCSGVRSIPSITLGDNTAIFEASINVPDTTSTTSCSVIAIFGVFDDVKSDYRNSKGTFCNVHWSVFLEKTGIEPDVLWGHVGPDSDEALCLWNARVFPIPSLSSFGFALPKYKAHTWLQEFNNATHVDTHEIKMHWMRARKFSLADILQNSVAMNEFNYRQHLEQQIDCHILRTALCSRTYPSLHPICRRACGNPSKESFTNILNELDYIGSISSFEVLARVYTVIADCLACASGFSSCLRAGHTSNRSWPLHLVKGNDIQAAVIAMRNERMKWLGSPELLIRASRHFEKAAQLTIAKAVLLKEVKWSLNKEGMISSTETVKASSPARIDLAGGWTDTPPITYEAGGTVLNAAIKVNGKCAFEVFTRRIAEPYVKLIICNSNGSGSYSSPEVLIIKSIDEMKDYDQPTAQGSLFKCVLIAMSLVSLTSGRSLSTQLAEIVSYGGIEVESRSELPPGSGLGGSSILAATLVAAVARAVGRVYSHEDINYMVLRIEQMLTSGGGWQDQVGGLWPGIKLASCAKELPVSIKFHHQENLNNNAALLSDHLVLIYTGVARLAKNLLQDVLRRWYLAEPGIVKNTRDLVDNANASAAALMKGDVESVGKSLSMYWQQKQLMAPSSRPKFVERIEDIVGPFCHGLSLCGAGGGGYMICITKEPHAKEVIAKALRESSTSVAADDVHATVCDVQIDMEGLVVQVY